LIQLASHSIRAWATAALPICQLADEEGVCSPSTTSFSRWLLVLFNREMAALAGVRGRPTFTVGRPADLVVLRCLATSN
jgi:hypothetical protein